MKPMNASQLALKSNPVSITNYTDGNVHEMYTFNHAATEQTPALTDYRYIGDDPYNYVYFNCDSLDNQNEETCEVWRIIGVFDVERPDPNDNTQTITERRMKLVRGSAFVETMLWDDRDGQWSSSGINDWNGAKLNVVLNGDYYNRIGNANIYGLKESSKLMINDTVYYLGGRKFGKDKPYFGSTELMYNWERGTEFYNYCLQNSWDERCQNINYCEENSNDFICSDRESSWIGKIGLIYPSDYGYTYSKGVDDYCYNDPYSGCKYWEEIHGYPENGWIYNSNNLEGEASKFNNWLISPHSGYLNYVFSISKNGYFDYDNASNNYGVRPTLYLSSSVKIIDGDGSINNPYKLSNS